MRLPELLACIALALTACGAVGTSVERQSAASPTSGPTELRVFQAWQGDGSLAAGLRAATTETDLTCDAATVSDGALRCLFGSSLRQPCFVSPQDRHSVACLMTPWDTDVVVGRLAQPLSGATTRGEEVTKGRLWAAELADGVRCHFTTGATMVVAGRRLDYSCSAGSGWGDPDRGHSTWTLAYTPGDTPPPSDAFESRAIKIAWF